MNTAIQEMPSEFPEAGSYVPVTGQATPMREDAIAARLTNVLEAGVKIRQIAIESGVVQKDIEDWIIGDRPRNVTKALSLWLSGIDEEVGEKNGDTVMTPTVEKILRAFERAREPKGADGRRGVALIYGASGAGKSEAAKWAMRMDENVVHVQADGERKTYVALLKAVLEVRSGYGHPANGEKLRDIVLRYVAPGGLLIFDHAHLIRLAVMEQLLTFPDEHGIALAFIGNTKGYKTLMDAKMAQINSRTGGAQVFIEIPGEDDIDTLLESWDIRGRKERSFCMLIGRQDGGLRYLSEMVSEAWKIARAGGHQKLDERLLKIGAVYAGCWGGV